LGWEGLDCDWLRCEAMRGVLVVRVGAEGYYEYALGPCASRVGVAGHCAAEALRRSAAKVIRDYGADGIYLDEIAYDRTTMLRARKVRAGGRTARCGVLRVRPSTAECCGCRGLTSAAKVLGDGGRIDHHADCG
jgi:hypothetical protein